MCEAVQALCGPAAQEASAKPAPSRRQNTAPGTAGRALFKAPQTKALPLPLPRRRLLGERVTHPTPGRRGATRPTHKASLGLPTPGSSVFSDPPSPPLRAPSPILSPRRPGAHLRGPAGAPKPGRAGRTRAPTTAAPASPRAPLLAREGGHPVARRGAHPEAEGRSPRPGFSSTTVHYP